MSEAQVQANPAAEATSTPVKVAKPKKEVVRTPVTMADGRVVEFVGTRKMQKSYTASPSGVVATFDFVNGKSTSITIAPSHPLVPTLIGHGLVQKIGDETATDDDIEDMVLSVEAMIERLSNATSADDWSKQRSAGDSFSGASVVLRALVEVTGLTLEQVKANIEKKLAETKDLTRADLYKSFRKPGTKTGIVVARLEAEKAAKNVKIDADAELAAWGVPA